MNTTHKTSPKQVRHALVRFKQAESLKHDFRLRAMMAATILEKTMQPEDAVSLSWMILDAIAQEASEDVRFAQEWPETNRGTKKRRG